MNSEQKYGRRADCERAGIPETDLAETGGLDNRGIRAGSVVRGPCEGLRGQQILSGKIDKSIIF